MKNYRSRLVNLLPIRVRRVSREANCQDLHTDPEFHEKLPLALGEFIANESS